MSERTEASHSLHHSRYWPQWAWWGLLGLLARIPMPIALWLGRRLGDLVRIAVASRRRVAARNLEICFPQQTPEQRQQLLKDHFQSLGMGLMESLKAWFIDLSRYDWRGTIRGVEHLRKARDAGQAVILLAGHFTTLEFAGKFITREVRPAVVYRKHRTPVFEHALQQRRLHYLADTIERHDLRAAVRFLREGGMLWYAPDQDFGPKNAVFADFFGRPAATITALSRLARLGKAVVLPISQRRLPGGRYEVLIGEPWQNFPSGDDEADARRYNAQLEAWIANAPADYLWVHRRFKTTPPGQASAYR
jgi:KDO2-lipid IV(A) lauroyltransferase